MRLIVLFLFFAPFTLLSQKVHNKSFNAIMKIDKVMLDPQAVKVDTLRRLETKSDLDYQLAASLAYYLLNDNRDSTLKLSISCPNLIYLREGTIILYWDGDMKSFQGTFIQDREHTLVQTIVACSRVYSMQQAPLISPDSPATEAIDVSGDQN